MVDFMVSVNSQNPTLITADSHHEAAFRAMIDYGLTYARIVRVDKAPLPEPYTTGDVTEFLACSIGSGLFKPAETYELEKSEIS